MKVHKEMLERWRKYATLYLADYGYTLEDVKVNGQAWQIAHKLDFPREAYHSGKSIKDSHIQTALDRIFPNIKR